MCKEYFLIFNTIVLANEIIVAHYRRKKMKSGGEITEANYNLDFYLPTHFESVVTLPRSDL
jgi:hypothetical protein